MKKLRFKFIYAVVGMLAFFSCEEIDKPTLNSAAVIVPELSETEVVLTEETKDEEVLTISWNEPDYGFAAYPAYTIYLDKADGDFSAPVPVANGNSVSKVFKVEELNKHIIKLGLEPGVESVVQIRVEGKLGTYESVVSEITTLTVTPYSTTFPPIYGMGNALNGWGPWPDKAAIMPYIAPNKYETFVNLKSGEAFRFFAQPDWGPVSYNYPYFTTVDANFVNAEDDDKNLRFVGTSGWYKINVDLLAKTVALEEATEPLLYMVGDAINGWNWNEGTPVKMTFITPGVFEAQTDFANNTFRFFAQADWSPTSYNYPFFTTVDSKFENANDDDKNLRFIGTEGSYIIKVDLNSKVVTMR